jgi:predicted DNA-binding transcriptional regulator YafY
MRAERLLRILLLLQTRGQATVSQLSRDLKVSPRTIQRDLDALSLAGVPIYSVRGRGGGWALLPDYRTRFTNLSPAEAMSVFVGATAHVLADLGMDAANDQGLRKLLAALPEGIRRDAEFARQRLLVDHTGWDDRHQTPPWLDVCRQGLWEERRVEITYRDRTHPFTVAPLGLVAKARAWYLVAARDNDAIRTFRVDRVTSASLTEQAFSRPEDFDLAHHWTLAQERFRRTFPSYPVVLRVRDHALRRFKPALAVAQEPDGWSRLETDLENIDEACAIVLALAGDAVVVEPAALIAQVRDTTRRITRMHR